VSAAIEVIPQHEKLIEDLVYEHLIDLVDFDRMYQLEQVVYCKLADPNDEIDADLDDCDKIDELVERSAELIKRAWIKLIDDPRRYIATRWKPDDDCPLCRALGGELVHGKDEDRDDRDGDVHASETRAEVRS
jgi:hypothetical protein